MSVYCRICIASLLIYCFICLTVCPERFSRATTFSERPTVSLQNALSDLKVVGIDMINGQELWSVEPNYVSIENEVSKILQSYGRDYIDVKSVLVTSFSKIIPTRKLPRLRADGTTLSPIVTLVLSLSVLPSESDRFRVGQQSVTFYWLIETSSGFVVQGMNSSPVQKYMVANPTGIITDAPFVEMSFHSAKKSDRTGGETVEDSFYFVGREASSQTANIHNPFKIIYFPFMTRQPKHLFGSIRHRFFAINSGELLSLQVGLVNNIYFLCL